MGANKTVSRPLHAKLAAEEKERDFNLPNSLITKKGN